MTKSELLTRIRDDRAPLDGLVAAIDDTRLSAPAPAGDWSPKDHVSHIAAWERMIVAHLADGSDAAIAGMSPSEYAAAKLDELNARLHDLHRDDPVAAVRTEFVAAHTAIVAVIDAMPEARLSEVYWTDDATGRTVIEKIAGDTYLHYHEHAGWIREIIGDAVETP